MKKQFLSLIAAAGLMAGVSQIKAMVYDSSKQLNDGTFLSLYTINQTDAKSTADTKTDQIEFAICRATGDAPAVVRAREPRPKTIFVIASFKANQADAANYFKNAHTTVNTCLKNGNNIQTTIIHSLQSSGMQILNN
jgi:hypothetical protein